MVLGLLITGFIGSLQAYQPGQSRSVAALQSQRGIGRVMSLMLASMVVVIALEREGAKQAIDLETFPSLALLPRLGLVGGIDLVGGGLQQPSHQRVGRLEDGGAHQHFQLLDRQAVGLPGLEASHQLLDFLVLGQKDLGRRVFFFEPASRSARVCSTMSCTYCCTSCWK